MLYGYITYHREGLLYCSKLYTRIIGIIRGTDQTYHYNTIELDNIQSQYSHYKRVLFLYWNVSVFVLKSFYTVPENPEERKKRERIEKALKSSETTSEQWKEFATSEYGLVNGNYPIENILINLEKKKKIN